MNPCEGGKQTQLYGMVPYSGLFSRRLYFANFAKAQPILENKNLERQLMWEEAWFSISIREITFREQVFAKYKRLENNPLYGIQVRYYKQQTNPLAVAQPRVSYFYSSQVRMKETCPSALISMVMTVRLSEHSLPKAMTLFSIL